MGLSSSSGLTRGSTHLWKLVTEILPFRVLRRDEVHLPGTEPTLQRFLALDRRGDVLVTFGVDKMLEIIMLGKSTAQALAVFPNAPCEIVGHPDLQCSVRMVRHDVHPSTCPLAHAECGGAVR